MLGWGACRRKTEARYDLSERSEEGGQQEEEERRWPLTDSVVSEREQESSSSLCVSVFEAARELKLESLPV